MSSWQDDLQAARDGDTDAAARLLLHAAGHLRQGDALPAELAYYLADAFEDAARQPSRRERADVLIGDLYLLGRAGAPKKTRGKSGTELDPVAIATTYTFSDESARRTTQALARAAGVSEGTIRNRRREGEALIDQRQEEDEQDPPLDGL